MIPKKLHITYAYQHLPDKYEKNLQIWKERCFDWTVHYYSNFEVYDFFKTYFPQYLDGLSRITLGALIADLFRYVVLYIHGGMYTDIDTIPLKKIPEKWRKASVVIGHEVQTPTRQIFCQWTLLSRPGHPLFKQAVDKAFSNLEKLDYKIDKSDQLLQATGPLFFSSIVKQFTKEKDLLLLDADVFSCCPELGIPFTRKSVVSHQFDGRFTWKLSLELPHLHLNRESL
jgi:mannosyltransferase OCH1-like enzyme